MRTKKAKRSKQISNKQSHVQSAQGTIIVTQHAIQRAQERLNWSKEKLHSKLNKIVENEVDIQKYHGRLKRYLKGKINGKKASNHVCLFGDILFFFKDAYLITLFRIPDQYLGEMGLGHNSIFAKASLKCLADLL